VPEPPRSLSWRIPATVVALCGLSGMELYFRVLEPSTPRNQWQPADPAPQKAPEAEVPAETAAAPAPPPAILKLAFTTNEAAWLGIYEDDKLTFAKVLEPGQTKTIESSGKI